MVLLAVSSCGGRCAVRSNQVIKSSCPASGRAPFFQSGKLRLVAPGFSREKRQWYNSSASELYGWFLSSLRSLDDLME